MRVVSLILISFGSESDTVLLGDTPTQFIETQCNGSHIVIQSVYDLPLPWQPPGLHTLPSGLISPAA